MSSIVARPHEAGGGDRLELKMRGCQPAGQARARRLAACTVLCFTLGSAMYAGDAFAQDGTIVALGDSNTAGFGVAQQDAFPARLETMLRKQGRKVRVVNAGVSGDTFGGLASRVDTSVPRNARLVIVQAGYNDRAMGVPPGQSVANMRTVLSKLRGRHVNTVMCGFFDKKWDAIGRKMAAEYGAKFVPGSTCYDPRHRGPDGLHMSASGHEVVAERLARVVGGGEPGVTKHARAHQNRQ